MRPRCGDDIGRDRLKTSKGGRTNEIESSLEMTIARSSMSPGRPCINISPYLSVLFCSQDNFFARFGPHRLYEVLNMREAVHINIF